MALSRAKTLDIRVQCPKKTPALEATIKGLLTPRERRKPTQVTFRRDENAACVVGLETGRRERKRERRLGREGKGPLSSRSHPSPAPRDRPGILEI